MPITTKEESTQLKQAGMVLAGANLLLWPFYWADRRVGVAASLLVSAGALYGMHQIGEKKEKENNNYTFFPPKPKDPLDAGFDKILAGGAAVYEHFTNPSPK